MTDVLRTIEALVEGEQNAIANMANTAAVLGEHVPDINWAGFYLMDGPQLVLGPFWGKPACLRIDIGKGVCGTAVETKSTQHVDDVHAFPGHIACDAASQSEVVVPMFSKGRVVAVLDVDSPIKARFKAEDVQLFEGVANVLENVCDWSRHT